MVSLLPLLLLLAALSLDLLTLLYASQLAIPPLKSILKRSKKAEISIDNELKTKVETVSSEVVRCAALHSKFGSCEIGGSKIAVL